MHERLTEKIHFFGTARLRSVFSSVHRDFRQRGGQESETKCRVNKDWQYRDSEKHRFTAIGVRCLTLRPMWRGCAGRKAKGST